MNMEQAFPQNLKRKKLEESCSVPQAWLSEYHWLESRGDLMFCTLCKRANMNIVFRDGVMFTKTFKKTRLDEHAVTDKHKDAYKLAADIAHALKTFSSKPKLNDESMMRKYRNLFRNIYFVAKNNLAFNLMEKLHAHISLMETPLPANHLSRTTGSEIVDDIALYLRDKILMDLKRCHYFSIMLDESTDQATTKQLIIFVKYSKQGAVFTKFLTILPLKSFNASGIYSVISTFFRAHELLHKILFICTDGAPVMRSAGEGVTGYLMKENPYVKGFHCIAHKFSLGVNATVNQSKYLQRVCSFVSDVYSYLYGSSKRVLALFENQKNIEEYTLNLMKPVKIRWLSFLRAASRRKDVYKSVYETLKQMAPNEAHAKGLKKSMEKFHTLLWIHTIADILPTLNFVLCTMEQENIDVHTLDACIQAAVMNLRAKYTEGEIKSGEYTRIKSQLMTCLEENSMLFGSIKVVLPKKNAS